ncbi:MAG: spore coat protein CotJB [Mahellales bacterium]|jgi:spore coat protein JB
MDKTRSQMLLDIQALEFAVIELNLYLDINPCDEKALRDYNAYACQLEAMKRTYAQRYGSLVGLMPSKLPCYDWIDEPWPWEIQV